MELLLNQFIPLTLTVVILGALIAVFHGALSLLNRFPGIVPVLLVIRPQDVIVGATIYLKTSIDFAILMGRLMAAYKGWQNRVAIEIGTAIGNATGTIAIILIWALFKNIQLLLALMILVAALVLLSFAHASLDQIPNGKIADILHKILDPIVRFLPKFGANLDGKAGLSWMGLLTYSMSVPFLLGLDDFAGYVPLFSVVNLYGFGIGVMAAHTLLNIALFLSPRRTIAVVQNAWISLTGTLIFIGLALYGILEAGKILSTLFYRQ